MELIWVSGWTLFGTVAALIAARKRRDPLLWFVYGHALSVVAIVHAAVFLKGADERPVGAPGVPAGIPVLAFFVFLPFTLLGTMAVFGYGRPWIDFATHLGVAYLFFAGSAAIGFFAYQSYRLRITAGGMALGLALGYVVGDGSLASLVMAAVAGAVVINVFFAAAHVVAGLAFGAGAGFVAYVLWHLFFVTPPRRWFPREGLVPGMELGTAFDVTVGVAAVFGVLLALGWGKEREFRAAAAAFMGPAIGFAPIALLARVLFVETRGGAAALPAVITWPMGLSLVAAMVVVHSAYYYQRESELSIETWEWNQHQEREKKAQAEEALPAGAEGGP